MKTLFATARFSLSICYIMHTHTASQKCCAHPTAPVPVVMMRTCKSGLCSNSSRIFSRLLVGQSPSMRWTFFEVSPCLLRYNWTRSNVRVQQVKMILVHSQPWFSSTTETVVIPFGGRYILHNIVHQRFHLRGLTIRSEIGVFLRVALLSMCMLRRVPQRRTQGAACCEMIFSSLTALLETFRAKHMPTVLFVATEYRAKTEQRHGLAASRTSGFAMAAQVSLSSLSFV